MPTSTAVRATRFALVLGLTSAGCAGPSGALRATPASAPAADRYDTGERPQPVLGARDPEVLSAAAHAAARSAGVPLRGDGRLALLARDLASECARDRAEHERHEAAGRLGLVEPHLELGCVSARSAAALPAAIERELRARLSARPATHFGLAVRADGESAAFVLSRRSLTLAPVPRRVEAGTPLRLRGRLDAVYAQPRLVVRSPSGAKSWPGGDGPDFDLQVPTSEQGCYSLALLARAGEQVHTVAELTVRAGGDGSEPPCAPESAAVASTAQLVLHARGLLQRIAALRAANALPSLATDRQLERAAARAGERAGAEIEPEPKAAEFGSGLVLLALARAADGSGLWSALAGDPALRAKLLNPDVTHVGVDVRAAPEGWSAIVLLARLAPAVDVELAPARVLDAINRNRAARSAAALRPDAALTRIAQRAANAFFEQPVQSEREIVAHANAELERFGLSYRRVAAVAVVVADPLEAAAFEPALDPAAGAAGVAVAAGVRPGSEVRSLAVVVALGWER
jgi:hypothetical protein